MLPHVTSTPCALPHRRQLRGSHSDIISAASDQPSEEAGASAHAAALARFLTLVRVRVRVRVRLRLRVRVRLRLRQTPSSKIDSVQAGWILKNK